MRSRDTSTRPTSPGLRLPGTSATTRRRSDYEDRASRLKEAFNEQFWLRERGYFAIGLDREKRPIDSLTSNIGHCLWSGIVDEDKAAKTVEHLCGPEMFTGWGIRTLGSSMGRYNPVSYHNGSVWPHDSAICAAGLARYGFLKEAQEVTVGLFEAAHAFGGRLPELFCGFDRQRFPIPIPYPASCSPQAWASASPFWLLRTTLLRLEPCIPDGVGRLFSVDPRRIRESVGREPSIGRRTHRHRGNRHHSESAGSPQPPSTDHGRSGLRWGEHRRQSFPRLVGSPVARRCQSRSVGLQATSATQAERRGVATTG